ncbi:MAG: hypothetical protein U0610_02425 [bacterium]
MTTVPGHAPDDERANPYQSFADETAAGSAAPAARDPALDRLGAEAEVPAAGRFRWLAVMVGYGSDYLLTEALDRIWWMYVAERVASGLLSPPSERASLLVLSLLGSASSVVGGFVCGMLAKGAELEHGVVQLVLGFAIFVLQVWTSNGPGLPSWYYGLTIPAVSAATVGGAWLARQRRSRRERGGR